MARASIHGPFYPEGLMAYDGNFTLPINFPDGEVTGFDTSNVTPVASFEFEVSGEGSNYNLAVTVPELSAGVFDIVLRGEVSVSGITEAIEADAKTIAYNTATVVLASFGEHEYDDNVIALPIKFEGDVLFFHKTDCLIAKLYGDDIYDFEYFLTETDSRNFTLTFIIPPDRRGAFSVDITGNVYTAQKRQTVHITPKLVGYDTYNPSVSRYKKRY